MKVVLTIGGSDSSGGAGIQADMKTILANGCYGMSVVTALAAHNKRGTNKLTNIDSQAIALQLELTLDAACPDAVKIGMLPNAETAHIVAEKLKEYDLTNIVINPILLSPDGEDLVPRDAFDVIVNEILPLADLMTPDLNELEYLADMKIETKEDIITASKIVSEKFGCTVATKGGRIAGDAADLFFREDYYKWFPGMIIANPDLHDAGNAISCAVAANLAKGYEPDKAYKAAKDFVTDMLLEMVTIGKMRPVINHNATIEGKYTGVLTDEELSKM